MEKFIKNQNYSKLVKIVDYELKKTQYGKEYMIITFRDNLKNLYDCRLWGVTPDYINIIENSIYFITQIQYTPYNEKHQFKILELHALDESEVPDLSEFEEVTSTDAQKMQVYLKDITASLEEGYQLLINDILTTYKDFYTIPAAKSIHHAYKYGLLKHTTSIVKILKHLQHIGVYTKINWNRTITAAILHDIGKVITYSGDDNHISTNYREVLFSHLYEGARIIHEVNSKNNYITTEEMEMLEHILLSHHGQKDWGALVIPATPEAILVAMIDNLDATMTIVTETTEYYKEGLTDKIYPLGTKMYLAQ